ncbi:MAG: anthranilate phosphoribosyltransferase [Alectoria sarmentosa]|nr:MAG: anthranilate phosphoribosyltransferase [Alectoria sarmentosa]
MSSTGPQSSQYTPITSLLKSLHNPQTPTSADEIADAFSLIFEDRLSPAQAATFLTLLSLTSRDKDADVLAACADRMRKAAFHVDLPALKNVVKTRRVAEGTYHGGLCDIVGTGGSSLQTYNISTTASLIASSLLLMSKHGNRAQTSVSGAADILSSIQPTPPSLTASNAQNIPQIYQKSSYAFLFAPNFHPGMRYAGPLRKEMGIRTIFNLLGPLAHPIEELVEARVVGVTEGALGPVFAEALRISASQKAKGMRKAMVVSGREGLDEISCAGVTNCWKVNEPLEDSEDAEMVIEHFQLEPADFGFPIHPLSAIRGGDAPKDNAEILMRLLEGKVEKEDPILQVVLMNTAAILVTSGICEAETSHMGFGDSGVVVTERGPGNGRWKEAFVEVSNNSLGSN